MDDYRFKYLIKTLSRTKRKDYENYVVNAVWNRLNDRTIKPASQWYVKNQDDSGWYLIDLYFPQINIGVECDEAYHRHNQDNDRQKDLTVTEVLGATNKHPYKAFRIDVDTNKSFEEIEQQINECVYKIKGIIKDRRRAKDFIEWVDVDLKKYFKDKQIIHSGDDILFPTIVDTVNSLMQAKMKGIQMGYFTPRGLDPQYKFWFPQLEVEGNAQARGWHNVLSEDGTTIKMHNDDLKKNFPDWDRKNRQLSDHTMVTFAKVRDPLTNGRAYKFVGLFELKDVDKDARYTYVKIGDAFEAEKHRVT